MLIFLYPLPFLPKNKTLFIFFSCKPTAQKPWCQTMASSLYATCHFRADNPLKSLSCRFPRRRSRLRAIRCATRLFSWNHRQSQSRIWIGRRTVIILDTHIWVWWVHGTSELSASHRALIDSSQETGIGVSAISCWEISKLVRRQRLSLPCPVFDWLRQSLAYPGIQLIELSPRICVESAELPGTFHKDPADQIIVATARILDAPIVTVDHKILSYPHVRHANT